jgi:hypothetical protein
MRHGDDFPNTAGVEQARGRVKRGRLSPPVDVDLAMAET